jgi:hypothetical protein
MTGDQALTAGVAGIAGLIEARALRKHHGTFSGGIERTFHTDTRIGKVAWTGVIAWLWWHCLHGKRHG